MKTNLEVLNEISAKLGGVSNATSVTESLNNIANALGDTNPDEIVSVSDSLEDILEYAGGGGGSVDIQPKLTITIDNTASEDLVYATGWELDGNNIRQKTAIEIDGGDTGTIETLVFGRIYDDELIFILEPTESILSGEIDSIDNLVNCTLDDNNFPVITDPSQPASCTVVMKAGFN